MDSWLTTIPSIHPIKLKISSQQIMRTAAESPDSNPIENLWNELKEYSRCIIKPRIEGIKKFWEIVTIAKCVKYINHLKKVLRKVVELNGAATAY